MKKVFLFIIFLSLVLLYLLSQSSIESSLDINDVATSYPIESNDINREFINDLELIHSEDHEIYIVKVPNNKKFKFIYDPENNLSLKDLGINNNLDFLINAGYFTEQKTHAGGLILNNKKYFNFVNDFQLTHVLAYNEEDDLIKIYKLDEFLNLNQNNFNFAFQTGPIVIKNTEIQYKFINNSLNGKELARRSLVGYDIHKNIYFVITRKVYTLEYLASILLNILPAENSITLVNLDGGSSTAMFYQGSELFQINEDKILPILFGF